MATLSRTDRSDLAAVIAEIATRSRLDHGGRAA
jgi:hypothetical protein